MSPAGVRAHQQIVPLDLAETITLSTEPRAELVRKRHTLIVCVTPRGIKRTPTFILLIIQAEPRLHHEAIQGTPRKASPARAGDGRRVCSVASAEVWWETVRTVAQSEPGRGPTGERGLRDLGGDVSVSVGSDGGRDGPGSEESDDTGVPAEGLILLRILIQKGKAVKDILETKNWQCGLCVRSRERCSNDKFPWVRSGCGDGGGQCPCF
ncbi:hypothetical protein PAL_GLEAN10024578 [Pteropus alecto]|uniref:Uncharacterized protein n=1 Tax=Pteropus alecto TaxID=9402 RepID=L5JXZ6_PTEAL|nr:hypothetical protein PAL_GLEAN10024578 [Pteropus alecto]